ncbi:MAG: hypothetical protein K5876_08120 [Ruminiclostridium sp.]|nr:hypothetical protein [Ruminiclostridium sp.]
MRIAGDTIRRSYLSRYEKNYSDKYSSEKKIYSGREFDRASENPIDAARALRVRKSISEVESYQDNLKTADSIYTNAESSMLTVSTIIQSVYEKLVEGAHGTRNPNDLEIIAMDIDNYAEEMVQSFNIDIADRKVFGGVNNTTPAFKIEGSGTDKYVTYNGVALNSSDDPQSFPLSRSSYLDIGIGITVNGSSDRIDDQSALPVTFNGAECTGCGMTSATASIDLDALSPATSYTFKVNANGKSRNVTFTTDPGNIKQNNITAIKEALKNAFTNNVTPKADGSITYAEQEMKLTPYEPLPMNGDKIDVGALKTGKFYSMKVSLNGMTKVIDFEGNADQNVCLQNMDKSLQEAFGEKAFADGTGVIHYGVHDKGSAEPVLNDITAANPLNTATGKINYGALTAGQTYAINAAAPVLGPDRQPLTDENGDIMYEKGKMVYFTAGATPEETMDNIKKYIDDNEIFGESKPPYIDDNGVFHQDVKGSNIILTPDPASQAELPYTQIDGYPNNLIQLVLDSAKMLRSGDQKMVARYADLVFASQSNLSIAISNLGTHAKFIEFNQDRLDDVKVNLLSKQNDIESTDLPSEITNWKVLESVYNASLQMGSSVLSQTIFNYIS